MIGIDLGWRCLRLGTAPSRVGSLLAVLLALGLTGRALAAMPVIEVAITVDDLPGQMYEDTELFHSEIEIVERMLEILEKNGVPQAYGFVTGSTLDAKPETGRALKAWVERGHPLGNHQYSHDDLDKMEAAKFISGIDRNEPILKRFSGKFDFRFFRYPFLREGDTPEKYTAVRKHLAAAAYRIAPVTLSSGDWIWNRAYPRCMKARDEAAIEWMKKAFVAFNVEQLRFARAVGQLLFGREVKHIYLVHAGAFSVLGLDEVLKSFRKVGVKFITLEEALKDPIYQLESPPPHQGDRSSTVS